ncbi:MAG: hypoxanthine phosphoribosyltransferase [Oscillospiraceae bacterium]|nr:hypoxanthine phosphoribosyltransferase [Oscillospiraceae bacterium]
MAAINILIDEEKIQKRVEELANQIMEDYKGDDLVFICILKGSIFFTVDLAKKIDNNVHLEFMKVSSYGENTVSSGQVELELDLKSSIEGKDVIVIEDIVDTGHTLKYILEYLKVRNPKTLKLCALLDKKERREVEVKVDYVGFEIPNKFVIGYGLDANECYRNLPYVGYLE